MHIKEHNIICDEEIVSNGILKKYIKPKPVSNKKVLSVKQFEQKLCWTTCSLLAWPSLSCKSHCSETYHCWILGVFETHINRSPLFLIEIKFYTLKTWFLTSCYLYLHILTPPFRYRLQLLPQPSKSPVKTAIKTIHNFQLSPHLKGVVDF